MFGLESARRGAHWPPSLSALPLPLGAGYPLRLRPGRAAQRRPARWACRRAGEGPERPAAESRARPARSRRPPRRVLGAERSGAARRRAGGRTGGRPAQAPPLPSRAKRFVHFLARWDESTPSAARLARARVDGQRGPRGPLARRAPGPRQVAGTQAISWKWVSACVSRPDPPDDPQDAPDQALFRPGKALRSANPEPDSLGTTGGRGVDPRRNQRRGRDVLGWVGGFGEDLVWLPRSLARSRKLGSAKVPAGSLARHQTALLFLAWP